MNSLTIDSNPSNLRGQQQSQENPNSQALLEDSNGLTLLSSQGLDFPQRVRLAGEFMGIESQEVARKLKDQKAKLREFQDRLKEFRDFESSFRQNGDVEESKASNIERLALQREEKWNKLYILPPKQTLIPDSRLNLQVLENSLKNMKKSIPLSKSSRSLLEARLENLEKNYYKDSSKKAKAEDFHGLALDMERKPNKNSRKMEKVLFKFLDFLNGSAVPPLDPIEEQILKKSRFTEDSYAQKTAKTYGFSHSDFRKIQKYKTNSANLPILSDYFEEDKVKLQLMNDQGHFETPKPKFHRNFLKPTNKPAVISQHDSEYHILSMESHIPVKTVDGKQEAYRYLDEIPITMEEKELAKEKMKKLRPEEAEKLAKQIVRKAWQNVVRNVIRIYRFVQKEHMEREQNSRRFALLCSKEVRKKYIKSQRMHREYQFRAKRMQKEMLVYWRKRERELNEIKKRKEKLESELKRREEEERESLLQQKRLEFLMKQSDIYAHFMARKLGIAIHNENDGYSEKEPNKASEEGGKTKPETVEIDEKAAFENVHMMINEQREMLMNFDKETQEARINAGGPGGVLQPLEQYTLEEVKNAQNLDFSYVPQDTFNEIINTPSTFVGELKEYQLKGLRWLDNLYDQGINGILADEMGLGKTIQAIALLAHISENKHNHGPFLIVAPSSTLYNWQQEIKRFCPSLKVLPYWGNLKQRKTIRKFFSLKNLGAPQSPFHVVITSYQLVVADEKTFQKMKWQYVILDEAQAIKNINSQRWKTLLSFNSRNKLLLTGTPIQNTMAELWALLHFIMPKLFDSHDQFQEWFSKDIEAHSQDQKAVNQHQLSRLHAILKPFMLRRVKKDVEHEIGQKKEFQILCEMTRRQQELYDNIKKRLSIKDFFQMFESKAKVESLMNLVMQFRKVCNHPELFERRPCLSPFFFQPFYYYTGNLPVYFGQMKEIICNAKSPIEFSYPKLIYDELNPSLSDRRTFIYRKFLIWSADNVYKESLDQENSRTFGFSRLLNLSPALLQMLFDTDELFLALFLLHFHLSLARKYRIFQADMPKRDCLWISEEILAVPDYYDSRPAFFERKSLEQIRSLLIGYNVQKVCVHRPRVLAPMIRIHCSSHRFTAEKSDELAGKLGKLALFGNEFAFSRGPIDKLTMLHPKNACYLRYPFNSLFPYNNQALFPVGLRENLSKIEIPDFASLVADSAKLNYLDKKLISLKKNNHRVLIFCQMTKMLDILEDYLMRKKYPFFRLDGSCNIADRRDMVHEFQTNHKIFAFLLSTRAGGLGVTLTAADTVIFYDNDWNPTMDAQATDRAHRIGQTKEVHVYRLVTKGTIEERIVKRAQQKQTVQATVYSGGAFKADIFKPQEVMELLFDENEIDVNETTKFMNRGGKKFKGKKKEVKIAASFLGKSKRSSRKPNYGDEDGPYRNDFGDEDKGNEEKNDSEIEMDFSPLLMNKENEEESSENGGNA